MSDVPQFETVTPTVLDARRVSIHIKTINLPETVLGACGVRLDNAERTPNVQFNLDGIPATPPAPTEPPSEVSDFEQSKFPVVEVNLVDEDRQSVAHSMIVEHRDPEVDITLHIREPHVGHTYTAYAEMIFQKKLVHVVEAPFILGKNGVDAQ